MEDELGEDNDEALHPHCYPMIKKQDLAQNVYDLGLVPRNLFSQSATNTERSLGECINSIL